MSLDTTLDLLAERMRDATVSSGRPGFLHIDFDRPAQSREEAVRSAWAGILDLIPGAQVTPAS